MNRLLFGLTLVVVVSGLSLVRETFSASLPAVSPTPVAQVKPGASPSPLPTLAATPIPSGTPTDTPSPQAALMMAEIKQLTREFNKAQSNELQALKHRQKMEMRELEAAQRAYRQEWQKKETTLAKDYYKTHKGAEFRVYMHDLQARRKAMAKMQDEDKHRRQQENEARLKAAKQDQESKLKEFKAALSRGERPSKTLWPQGLY
jgi:pyruvate-formate lyase